MSLGQGCIHFLEHNVEPGEMTCGRTEILPRRNTTLWNGNNGNLWLFCKILALWIKDSQTLFIHFYKWIFVKGYESDFNQINCVVLNSVCGLGNCRPSLKAMMRNNNLLSNEKWMISEWMISLLKMTKKIVKTVLWHMFYGQLPLWISICAFTLQQIRGLGYWLVCVC